ncbi:NAD(P)-binding protein [Xylariomycetidae sp. FL2044]|nr:NAD(P)-binding protein [Xylariomycetidae sp. FL2044]
MRHVLVVASIEFSPSVKVFTSIRYVPRTSDTKNLLPSLSPPPTRYTPEDEKKMPHTLTIKKTEGKPGQVYYPLQLNTVPKPTPGPNELLIRLHAAALNHRDLFIRQHLYPRISFAAPLLADGCGTVVEVGPDAPSSLLHRRVILTPLRGWDADPAGPEDMSRYAIIGGARPYEALGAAQDYVVVGADEVEVAPLHLSTLEAAALPLVGLTAYRALFTKSGAARAGTNILVTGIGGGVALAALQFGVALGCNVYVTSGDPSKLERAAALGARGGVSYREDGWDRSLAALLPASRPYLDAVIDGAGGDVVGKVVRLLKPGGVIAQYGMTAGPRMDWLMQAVLRHVDLRGCTMGSRREFRDMVAFVAREGIRPVVSRSVAGLDDLDAIDGLFEDMRHGRQFGKLVIEISSPEDEGGAKL